MKLKVYTMDSFAKTSDGGNPAAVVLNADNLSASQMKAVAKKIGFSETAFVMASDKADFKVRFFTPTDEVDLCGHATIGFFYLMAVKGSLKTGMYSQETNAGILSVEITEDQLVLMDQSKPKFYDYVDRQLIAESLGITVLDLHADLQPQIVSTGMRDIMVPIKNLETLQKIVPNMALVSEVSSTYDTIGYHLFSLESLGGTAHTRNLAPLYGIPEESACGTANGALSSYLYHHQMISSVQAQNIVMEQGYTMNKPSEILASLETDERVIQRVRIGGTAKNINEMTIEV